MDFASILEAGGSLALSIGVFAFAVWLNRKRIPRSSTPCSSRWPSS